MPALLDAFLEISADPVGGEVLDVVQFRVAFDIPEDEGFEFSGGAGYRVGRPAPDLDEDGEIIHRRRDRDGEFDPDVKAPFCRRVDRLGERMRRFRDRRAEMPGENPRSAEAHAVAGLRNDDLVGFTNPVLIQGNPDQDGDDDKDCFHCRLLRTCRLGQAK